MADMRPLADWSGPAATLTMWHPSSKSITAAKAAPISPIPPSYEQAQHLNAFFASHQRQEEMSRLLIVVWEEAGLCEHSVMSEVITNHLRRHDTYHSWFEKKRTPSFATFSLSQRRSQWKRQHLAKLCQQSGRN
jgi:hypothetical protein